MKNTLQKSTRYFQTYEAREQAFRESVYSLIPRKYSGPHLFWQDFSHISLEGLQKLIAQPLAYITSNPRDCLAFGTPWQVLTAAGLQVRAAVNRPAADVEQVAADFGVYDNLQQPIRTLSGGETVKLALAKSFVTAACSRRLSIASPFSWLSHDNAHLFKRLFEHYAALAIPVELFALDGEDCQAVIGARDGYTADRSGAPNFGLRIEGVRIGLGTSINPIYARQAHARVADFEAELVSPCLIVGENGQGKSLIAKVLAGALPSEGAAQLNRAGKPGPARLLFQDVITQTLLRSFDALAASAPFADRVNVRRLYTEISDIYFRAAGGGHRPGAAEKPVEAAMHSLLEIKMMLVAVRLCGHPRALILDEPDWGLTRASSIAYVAAVVKSAHELGTPVILISHKPWWTSIAGSTLRVAKIRTEPGHKGEDAFQIRLRCEGCEGR